MTRQAKLSIFPFTTSDQVLPQVEQVEQAETNVYPESIYLVPIDEVDDLGTHERSV